MKKTVHRWASCLLIIAACLPAGCAKKELPADTRLFLVGVGPGDYDLASVRAVNVIKAADVIVCFERSKEKYGDFIGGKEVIAVPHGFWHHYGKKPSDLKGEVAKKEERISQKRDDFIKQVRDLTARGKIVAVLDSGDPMIYGPWAWILEEFEDLNPAVVPGISCFNAAHAAIGKSPTITGPTKSVILTANDWPGKKDTIDKLAKHGASMALFTMRAEYDFFISKLKAGYPPNTPVAIVIHAGYKDKEKVITATLDTIDNKIKGTELPFEYMIYIGDFITYRQKRDKSL
ncbi:MAG: tetrapyrrole methylase [Spirochaetes bacterium]|nr:tetrapyrrole methylase [Spirochaetota bacterium]